MPLKLRPPRKGKTPNWSIRGTYLGIYVERTAGTPDKAQAQRTITRIRKQIERGEYVADTAITAGAAAPIEPTFAAAALAYLRADGDPNGISAIIEHTGEHALRDRKLSEIDQIAIDNAANALYPDAPAQTKNRQFYTPVSAILKRAGIDTAIRRPKGWRGNKSTSWLEPDQAFRLIDNAYAQDQEFGLFCLTLLYTGMRLGDIVGVALRDLKIDEALLYVPDTKNGEPRPVHLPPIVVEAMRALPPRPERPRKADSAVLPNGAAGRNQADAGVPWLERSPDAKLFRFHAGTPLRQRLARTMEASQLSFPRRQGGFHIFCHTYGTWMRRYGQLDTFGLVRTGRWKNPESASRYNHTIASEEARRADLLPTARRMAQSGENPGNAPPKMKFAN
ncbi:MAG: tyrosine-type recombinase/integrase [Rhodobacteraceae bacterium]|nr:tyrosine-type recombinase/integrase [Paracoccaceae bacterium]